MTFDEWWRDEVTSSQKWAHCGKREPHAMHTHSFVMNEGPYTDVPCIGTPDFSADPPQVPDPPEPPPYEAAALEALASNGPAMLYAEAYEAGRRSILDRRATPADRLRVLDDVSNERDAQVEKWGEQTRPDFPADATAVDFEASREIANHYRRTCNERERDGERSDWAVILLEEVWEAMSERDYAPRRKELVQSAAVIVAWIEDMDKREEVGT